MTTTKSVNRHVHNNLPTLVAGGGVRGGRHVLYPKNTPIMNLHLTMLNMAGVPLDQVRDSTGRLDLTGICRGFWGRTGKPVRFEGRLRCPGTGKP